MAIIYTYPKLTNPQGNELIVVSDVNNRNSTRLITIASIASLVPSGGGCSTAITGIVDNLGAPLYTALACSEMELVSTDGSVDIAATATGIDLTVDASFDLECASAAALGGFFANQVAIGPPTASGTGTYYPVEVSQEGCTGVVRIPDSAGISCAEPTTIGGVKALKNTTETVMPTVSEEGSYYPIEVVNAAGAASSDLCRAIVKVPSSGGGGGCSDVWKTITTGSGIFSFDASGCDDTLTLNSAGGTITISSAVQGTVNFEVASIPCADVTTIGGIKVGSADTAVSPVIDESGTAYSVETNTSCEAYVRVPDASISCATSGAIGGIKVNAALAGVIEGPATGLTYPVQVDESCIAGVTIPSSVGQGFSPLDIYNGTGFLPAPFTLASQTVCDLTLDGVNKVKVFANQADAGAIIQCHVWVAEMNDPAGMIFKGSGTLNGIVAGMNTIDLAAFDLVAGENLVIYWTLFTSEALGILVANGIAGDAISQASTSYTASPSNVLATALSPLTGSGSEEAANRVACHFYKQP